jgi:nitrogen fixation-related uncharacterized protein
MELILITIVLVALAAASQLWGADSRRFEPRDDHAPGRPQGSPRVDARKRAPRSESYLSWWPLPTEGLVVA